MPRFGDTCSHENSQQDRRGITSSVRARKETEVEQPRSDPLPNKWIFSSFDKKGLIMTPSTLTTDQFRLCHFKRLTWNLACRSQVQIT
jgi:hypothetical protein